MVSASWGCQHSYLLSYVYKKLTLHSLLVLVNYLALWVPWTYGLMVNTAYKWRDKQWKCVSLLMLMFHCSIKLYLQISKSKVKLLRISRRLQQNIQPSTGSFLHMGLYETAEVNMPMMFFLNTILHSIVVKGGNRTNFNRRSYKTFHKT